MLENRGPLKILVILILLAGASFFGIWEIRIQKAQKPQVSQTSPNTAVVQSSPENPKSIISPKSEVFFPLGNYVARLTVRDFGKIVKPGDEMSLVCGRAFSGIHDGDDLETTPLEANTNIPVYSIAAGTVLHVSAVDGYGGLIVAAYHLNNDDITAYYGHLSLASAVVKPGDIVVPGEKLANLGKGCSPETSGERKHLHFAIHKGRVIDVRGYVQSAQELTNWLDPLIYLQGQNAVEKNN